MFFVSTVITFWGSDYLENIMAFPHSQVFLTFVVICITGPILGIFFGGLIVQNIGGYESKHSILYCIVTLAFAFVATLPLYWMNDIQVIGAIIWILMFCGGSIIPIIMGILISSLPTNLRASGNSVCNIFMYFLGWFPAPSVYAFIYQETKTTMPRLALSMTIGCSIFSIIFLCIAAIVRYKKFKDPNSQENLNLSRQNPLQYLDSKA